MAFWNGSGSPTPSINAVAQKGPGDYFKNSVPSIAASGQQKIKPEDIKGIEKEIQQLSKRLASLKGQQYSTKKLVDREPRIEKPTKKSSLFVDDCILF